MDKDLENFLKELAADRLVKLAQEGAKFSRAAGRIVHAATAGNDAKLADVGIAVGVFAEHLKDAAKAMALAQDHLKAWQASRGNY